MVSRAIQQVAGAVGGRPYFLLVLTMTLWAGNAVASRVAAGLISPMALTAARWLVVSLLFVTLLRASLVEAAPQLRQHWRRMALMGVFGLTLFSALLYLAGGSTTAFNISVLQGSMPIMILLGGALFTGTRIGGLQLAGVLVTMAGVIVTASHGSLQSILQFSFNRGDLFILLACALYSGYTIALRNRPAMPALAFFGGMALAAFATSLPLLALEIAAGAFHVSWGGLAILVFVGLGPSFTAQISFMRAVELMGPGRAGIFANLTPVFGAFLAVMLLSEPFGWHHAAALVMVIGGIAIAEAGKPEAISGKASAGSAGRS